MSSIPSRAASPATKHVHAFLGRAALFLLVGAILYGAVYAAAEMLVYRYGHRNRFFAVRSATPSRYDFVVLGASHAGVLDYRDMNSRLEQLTDAKIMNLSVVGGGITINTLLLDYFLTRHETNAVVYVVDSFAFYSPEWNEDRLEDRRLFARAPFDVALVELLFRSHASPSVALDYASGFSKINNHDRFAPDLSPDEGVRFDRRYRPVTQLDEERLAYLYPRQINPETFRRYLAEFETLIGRTRARGAEFIALKPPIPERIRRLIPDEAQFDAALEVMLERHGVRLHDFSNVGNDESLFQDTDHLNRAGVLGFFRTALGPLLSRKRRHHK